MSKCAFILGAFLSFSLNQQQPDPEEGPLDLEACDEACDEPGTCDLGPCDDAAPWEEPAADLEPELEPFEKPPCEEAGGPCDEAGPLDLPAVDELALCADLAPLLFDEPGPFEAELLMFDEVFED